MLYPTIHLNGTSKNTLLDQLGTASSAITVALAALGEATPNDRDYYLQGPQAGPQAREEHAERMRKLEGVRAELEAIAEQVADAGSPAVVT